MIDYLAKKASVEKTANKYHGFLAYAKKVDAKPNDVFKA